MSREIDRLAQPASKTKIKVIVASCSRTGTLGLHSAMKILGFTPYHMVEVLAKHGWPHQKIVTEAVVAQANRFSGIKRYERPELDKWMAGYDCLIEVPSYLGMRAMEGYINDPEVKFILTERDPDKWVRSFNNTAGAAAMNGNVFPMNILKHFNNELWGFFNNCQIMYWSMSDGTDPGHPNNEEALRKNYIDYIRTAKERLPKERLLVIRLEDGLGWEQICPFLDMPIPDEPYPPPNVPEVFKALGEAFLRPWIRSAMFKCGALVTPVVGVAGYLGWRYFRP